MMSTLVVGSAGADPQGEEIPLECDNGESYVVNANGNGEFTPGRVADGTAVFVPVGFGPFTFTVTDAQGNVVESGTEPASAKGQSAKGVKDAVTCTFTFGGTEDGFTFEGSGSVVARITPAR
jgi:hypothetical protein